MARIVLGLSQFEIPACFGRFDYERDQALMRNNHVAILTLTVFVFVDNPSLHQVMAEYLVPHLLTFEVFELPVAGLTLL
jgi:hypothetical protein